MSQFSFSASTFKKREFSSLLLSHFFHICFFILSHPLYFSYFIFFSPYLLKLLSFLSPLFITTFLLLLVLLTFSPNLVQEHSYSELSESGVGFLVGTCQSVFERLQSKGHDEDENSQQFEDLEVYKIVFDTSTFEIREDPAEVLELEVKEVCSEAYDSPVDKSLDCGDNFIGGLESLTGNSDAYPAETIKPGITQQIVDVKRLECFLQEKNELETMWGMEEDKEVNQPGVESYKVEERTEKLSTRSGSEAVCNKTNDTTHVNTDYREKLDSKMRVNSRRLGASMESPSSDGEYYSPVMENYQTFDSNLGSFGSMRKEKEWRRTLACKLFEERHNVDGSEGMDLLWETYETESSKVQAKSNKKGKNSGVDYEDEDEEEEDMDAQLCCLQALKFSAGKMNLGMGRPNLVKISKALKGIGWLHNLGRNGKKVYH
ncbi:hypothetical protein I3842_13G048900 [Carya illinoinensis]|uniref:Uncharacterized protein n=1 Tax=Carya illinoinensis TaxID=32201 RepID=A0A922DBD7_CARIL|nr:hypothetical protein I3842_13G048900 [Carya illinoinensis]